MDRVWADVLFDAAERANCCVHLAQLTRYQDGMPSDADGLESRSRSDFYSDSYDEKVDGPYPHQHRTLDDIYEEKLSLDSWSDAAGKAVSFGEFDLDEDEIIADPPCKNWDPTREEVEGYTGNEGVTSKRWYHRAAIVVWPRDKHFAVLCDAGTPAAIKALQSMLGQLKRASKARRAPQREQCIVFAREIISSWSPPQQSWSNWERTPSQGVRVEFPDMLCELDEPQLVSSYLTAVLVEHPDLQIDKSIVDFMQSHGWALFEPALNELIDETSSVSLVRDAGIFEMICTHGGEDSVRVAVCRQLADRLISRLKAIDLEPPSKRPRVIELDRSELLCLLLKGMLTVQATDALSGLISHTLDSDQYVTNVHNRAIKSLQPWLDRNVSEPGFAVTRWRHECEARLKAGVAMPPH